MKAQKLQQNMQLHNRIEKRQVKVQQLIINEVLEGAYIVKEAV